jgi:hypothetical protein
MLGNFKFGMAGFLTTLLCTSNKRYSIIRELLAASYWLLENPGIGHLARQEAGCIVQMDIAISSIGSGYWDHLGGIA